MITVFGPFRQVSGVSVQRTENRRSGEKANRRMSNVEPQNVEGWNRCALSFL